MATSDSPLSVPDVTLAVARASSTPTGPQEPDLTLPAGNIVSDDFSSGDLDATGPTGGFTWGTSGNQRFTSLVTMDPATGDPTVILTSGGTQTYNVLTGDPRDWNALHGENSLRFAFLAGGDAEVFSEQRWALVSRAERTFWERFALRVPTNYSHDNVAGSPTTSNNKLATVWMDAYETSGDGSTVFIEMYRNGSGGSNLGVKRSPGRNSVVFSVGNSAPFISVPEDRGRWMYLCFKVVVESAEDASDGTIEVWRKWAGEASWTKLHDYTGQPIRVPTTGPQGFAAGYLLGADNSGYLEDTEWLLDDFNLSTGSLL